MKKKEKIEEVNEPIEETQETTNEQVEEQKEPQTINWAEKFVELNNSHLRLMADFDNYRKRTIKEKAELIKNGGERVVSDFLPLIDNFERALNSMEAAEDVAAVRSGVDLIYNQLLSIMKSNGVVAIETEGKQFDTEFHEAITTIPAPTPEQKDMVIDCTTKGYTMNEKVIRHSKVVVGS